jgi:Mn-dependent DtxR family transcriptional regulator
VHHSADAIEHIITPELEKLLSSDLGHPGSDPHDQPIPGPSSSSGLTTPPS